MSNFLMNIARRGAGLPVSPLRPPAPPPFAAETGAGALPGAGPAIDSAPGEALCRDARDFSHGAPQELKMAERNAVKVQPAGPALAATAPAVASEPAAAEAGASRRS